LHPDGHQHAVHHQRRDGLELQALRELPALGPVHIHHGEIQLALDYHPAPDLLGLIAWGACVGNQQLDLHSSVCLVRWLCADAWGGSA
jgi:hypothetical protein